MNKLNHFSNSDFALITNSNGYLGGFKNLILSGNKVVESPEKGKAYLHFTNYDYKNQLEKFASKQNNPLQFPKQLFVEAEVIDVFECENEFIFPSDNPKKITTIFSAVSKEKYIKNVGQIMTHIQLGDIYEMNYCISFEVKDIEINPIVLYQKLNSISKAPYSALAKFKHQYIISSSPELFLNKHQNILYTKPIKGTARRDQHSDTDKQIKTNLQNNLKERTENVMIVDVARNDLSRLASKGSVEVKKLFEIESFEQVHQMVSTIQCEIEPTLSFQNIINVTFPMASMTGAPKIRAMELADKFELYNRGPYSGTLGYILPNGDFDLSVLIRSIFYDSEKKYLSFSVGSAITAMCDPETEYHECLLKAKAMIEALSA